MQRADTDTPTAFFWDLAAPLLAREGVSDGTMMGFPCLRVRGAFFASCDHRSGDLIVKLPRERVAALIAAGEGLPFAPAGRVFKEWLLVPDRDEARWEALLTDAYAFVGGGR
jgi:hypothetical protein